MEVVQFFRMKRNLLTQLSHNSGLMLTLAMNKFEKPGILAGNYESLSSHIRY